jgi:uncharacterized RDD family membrane protein YckC
MNLRLLCLLCALTLDWLAPHASRGQTPGQQDEPPLERTAGQVNLETPGEVSSRKTRRRSQGDVVTIGADAVVKENETVHDVVVVGGSANVEGTVTGDLVVVLGDAKLGSNAVVRKDLVVVGGTLEADPSAHIGRTPVVVGGDKKLLRHLGWLKWPVQWFNSGLLLARPLPHQYWWSWTIAGIALLLYMVMAVLFPRQVQATVEVLEAKPGSALFAGLLTFALVGPLFLLLVITVVGLIVVPLVVCGMVAAFLFGKVAVYRYAGQQVGAQLGWAALQKPLLALLAGALLFCLLYTVPVVGFLTWGAVTTLGVGAVLLAVFKRSPTSPTSGAPGTAVAAAGAAASGAPPELGIAESSVLLPRVGFWWRTLATALDLALVGMVMAAVFHRPRWFLLAWVTYHLVLWSWRGTTVGGIVFGLKIVRLDGQPMNFAVALVRLLGGFFSAAAFGLGFFWAGWSRDKQSWHDKIAGTIVVKSARPTALV